tara:strand:+ start:245 stop:1171 length:927 start_codon:yes stop_codon:yes gene_type:complete
LFILVFFSIFIFFIFHKPDNKKLSPIYLLSKETSIVINNWFMMYFLSVILIGTIYPIFLDAISSEKISVGPPFYHKLITPFLIPFLIFMAIGPQLKWIKSELKNKLSLVILFVISILISFFIVKTFNANYLLNSILIGSAFYLFFISVRYFFIKKNSRISQNIAHFGFSLLILSILFNSIFSKEIITNLKIGDTYKNDNLEIVFKDLKKEKKINYISYIGIFSIKDENFDSILKPELRIYNQPNIITSEADIKVTLFQDNFITINTVKNEDYFNVRYLVKPFMLWIWISVLLISFGGLTSLFNKKKYD